MAIPDYSESVVPLPNNVPYLLAIVAMAVVGVTAVVLVSVLRPAQDNSSIITTILGLLAPTTLSLLAFMKAQETHLSVNSRLDAFMREAKYAAHAKGLMEGRGEGREMADARTDTLAKTKEEKDHG